MTATATIRLRPTFALGVLLLAGCAPAITGQTATPTPETSPTAPAAPTGTAGLPSPAPVLIYRDIPYEQIQGVDPNLLSLDIYAPLAGGLDAPQPAAHSYPVLVMIHGGSWRESDKNTASVAGTKSQYFTAQGVVFVSLNYRLAPQAKHPAQVRDVAAALAWIHTYIGHYGGDAGQIYVMGHSAGGQLAALAATDERYLEAQGMQLGMLKGVILLDGVGLDIPALVTPATQPMYANAFGTDPAVWKDASPVEHIAAGKGIPPFLIFYAGQTPDMQATSQELAQALTAAGVKNWLVAAEGRTHATITEDVGAPGDPVTLRIMEFLGTGDP